jgi:GT2 family glycosyltransferase/glycosyltransferase involved in cell wall biosynthesis
VFSWLRFWVDDLMRILEIVHGFPPRAQGGAELHAHAHARALRDSGDEVLVLARDQDPDRAEYDCRTETRDGLRIAWVNNTFRNTRTFEEAYRNEAIGAVATRVIDDFRPDAAHIHHLTGLSTTIVRSLAERLIPSVLTLHDYWLMCHRGQLLDLDCRVCDGPGPEGCHACLPAAGSAGTAGFAGAVAVRALERRLPEAPARQLRRMAEGLAGMMASPGAAEGQERRRIAHMREVCGEVTHFLAPSRYVRDRFVECGVPPERITVSGNGVDQRPFRGSSPIRVRTWGPPLGGPLRLGFLGSLMISKAPHLLLEAAARLPRGSVSVDLFGAYSPYHGDDSYRQQLEPLLREERVRVHGAIAHEQVAEAFGSIDVLVVPSIWPENAPLVIQEAFLAGIPVVASRIGGIPEMVADGKNGLLFRAGDIGDLSRTLARCLDEPGLLDTLRAGIPPVRSIEDDVRFARSLYQSLHQPRQSQGPSSEVCSATSSSSAVNATRIAATVLNYRTPDETLLAVKSLLASRRRLDDIIVVNNDSRDSRDDTRDALRDVWSKITYIQTGGNLGFSGGTNAGIREALARGADRVLLVNSDVIVPPDAVEHLERCLGATPGAGIAGPVVLARSEPDRIASLGMSYAPSTGRMRHRGNGATAGGEQPEARLVDGVSGCLMLVKRDVFEAVGLFDEEYFFSFEDLDFCLKARRAGFATVLAGRATVYHEGGQSLGATSPRRFYFAARNHLLLARRAEPSAGRFRSWSRTCSIVMLNLAHSVVSPGGSLPARLGAAASGTRDYLAGRFGAEL